MTISPPPAEAGSPSLAQLESALLAGSPDAEIVRRYYDTALLERRTEMALECFERLLARYPAHQQVRSLYISLCLQQGRFPAAMEAIQNLMAFTNFDAQLVDIALSVREKIGPKMIEAPQSTHRATLSVCMIVRNEQRYLPACLHALRDLADEIVVVDTGSQDRTADIARIFGARVSMVAWKNNFSAARNAGLAAARGDWILVVDADEIVAGQDHATLRALVTTAPRQQAAYILETRNYTHNASTTDWHANNGGYAQYESGLGWFSSRKIRLFPNSPAIRFQYPVHELVDPAVRALGLPIVLCPIPVHHYGHLNEKRNREKAEAYFRIGYTKLNQLGDDVAAIRELAVQAGQLERWDAAVDLWERVLGIRPDFAEAHVNLSGACWQQGRYDEALHHARAAIALAPDSKEAHYNLAVSLLLSGNGRKAVAALETLNRRHPDYLAGAFMLGAALGCTGAAEASDSFLKALQHKGVGKAVIALGLQDLIGRLRSGGLDLYAAKLMENDRWYKLPRPNHDAVKADNLR